VHKKICDICKKTVDNLNDLLPIYATVEIREICDTCLQKINLDLTELKKIQTKILISTIKQRISEMEEEAKVTEE